MMRTLILTLIASFNLIICSCTPQNKSNQNIRVMTFNIRVNVASDSLNSWQHRKEMVANTIQFHSADLVGIQEALLEQVEDLAALLPNYSWLGVGRDDGDKLGEFMAIFYLKDRLKVMDHATFWLSENPQIPGRGWDAACNRVVTWGKLQDNKSGKTFYHFNTHFDHVGETARIESAKLLLEQIKNIAGISNVVVTGDFNTSPDSKPYEILTVATHQKTGLKLVDTKTISYYPHHGPTGTFTGFNLSKLGNSYQPIDFILVTNNLKVLRHGTLSDIYDGFFPSDHMPVLAEIIFE